MSAVRGLRETDASENVLPLVSWFKAWDDTSRGDRQEV